MAKNNIIVFGESKTKKKGTQADQMHGIARCMRQQADFIEKGTKILECEAASYLAEVELDFADFTLSDNSTNELFQLFTGMEMGSWKISGCMKKLSFAPFWRMSDIFWMHGY